MSKVVIPIDVEYEDDVLERIEVDGQTFENTPGSSADTIIDAIEYAFNLGRTQA